MSIKVTKADKTPAINPKKVEKVYIKLIEAFKETKLTVPEIILAYSNLGYSLGASIGGYKDGKGPSVQDLQKAYATNPTIDVALMLDALTVGTWVDDLEKKYEEVLAEQKVNKNGQK